MIDGMKWRLSFLKLGDTQFRHMLIAIIDRPEMETMTHFSKFSEDMTTLRAENDIIPLHR